MSHEQIGGMEEWQETYNWASATPPETPMDGDFWWNACLTNILAKAFKGTKGVISKKEIQAPQPQDVWKSNLLDALYPVLFPAQKLTVGQFRSALEQVRPSPHEGKSKQSL